MYCLTRRELVRFSNKIKRGGRKRPLRSHRVPQCGSLSIFQKVVGKRTVFHFGWSVLAKVAVVAKFCGWLGAKIFRFFLCKLHELSVLKDVTKKIFVGNFFGNLRVKIKGNCPKSGLKSHPARGGSPYLDTLAISQFLSC